VTGRRTRDWLARWIAAPNDVLAAGDSVARRLLAESNGVPMPNLALAPAEVVAVLSYLEGTDATPPAAAAAHPPSPAGDPVMGRALFQGRRAFANRGPTCNSCHEVRTDSVLGGGALAPDLTAAYSKLGDAGLQGIVTNPPFPVMQRAYRDKRLTDDEVVALVAFLKDADGQHAMQRSRGYGVRLFGAGAGGSLLLLGLYSLVWGRRLKGSVHQRIYDRQMKST
jgi:mono/diheme cytochrome c family protein